MLHDEEKIIKKYLYGIELLLWGSHKGFEIQESPHYCTYYYTQCKLNNPRKLHIWLLENGYIRKANLYEALNLYIIPELKVIAEKYGCKKSGKKEDLINRIIASMPSEDANLLVSDCNYYFNTEKGNNFYFDNYDLVELHLSDYHIAYDDYIKYRTTKNFETNARNYLIDQLKLNTNQRQYHLQMEIFLNLFKSYKKSGEGDTALLFLMHYLFFTVNLAHQYHYFFNSSYIKMYGLKQMGQKILDFSIISPFEIREFPPLEAYYTQELVERIYNSNLLPVILLDKQNFGKLMHDIFNSISINQDYYIEIVQKNYMDFVSSKMTIKRKLFSKKIYLPYNLI